MLSMDTLSYPVAFSVLNSFARLIISSSMVMSRKQESVGTSEVTIGMSEEKHSNQAVSMQDLDL